MKVDTTIGSNGFRPITLNIIIESEAELRVMWNIFNRSVKGLVTQSKSSLGTWQLSEEDNPEGVLKPVWERLDNII